MPNVSVIIPAFNGDRFIAEAVESVLNQTYQDYEIIVVDDGSTDRTQQVLEPYSNYIRYVYHPNQGVAVARNRGIELAQGEFIAFLDQDDVFLADKLAVQIALFEQNPELDIAHSGWQVVTASKDVLSSVQPWEGLPVLNQVSWIEWKPVFLGAMLFRKDCLQKVEGFDRRFQQTSDVDLVLRLVLMNCQAEWVKQATVQYRQHDHNHSKNVLQQVEELEAVLDHFFGRSDLPEDLRKLEGRSRYQSLVWSAWRLYEEEYMTNMSLFYLKKSLYLSSLTFTETIVDWLDQFNLYGKEHGSTIDAQKLSQDERWQALIDSCLPLISSEFSNYL